MQSEGHSWRKSTLLYNNESKWAMQDLNPRRRVRSPSGYPGYPNRPYSAPTAHPF
jgi:hypothetical protein